VRVPLSFSFFSFFADRMIFGTRENLFNSAYGASPPPLRFRPQGLLEPGRILLRRHPGFS